MGAVTLIDVLLQLSAVLIQIQVQTMDNSLKPGFGTQNNILLPAPQAIQPMIPRGWRGHGPFMSQTGGGSPWSPLGKQAFM